MALLVPVTAQPQKPEGLGGRLAAGTQLVYSSGGVETPWRIDSIAADTIIAGRPGCVRLRLRLSPTQRDATTRAFCAAGETLFLWDERAGTLRVARPIAGGRSMDVSQAAGGSTRYETDAPATDTIDGMAFNVIPTTVTTRDSVGRTVRRLRERFSVELLTATGGVFEVPDSTQPGGWREERRFALVGIRIPPPFMLLGEFVDDYGIRHRIGERTWTQLPAARYHIFRWQPEREYLIAQNDSANKSDPGLWTRIDWLKLEGMAPYEWGFCLSAYKAPSAATAESVTVARRDTPRTGCNGFPFSRMRRDTGAR